jgi:hypothetical protein
MFIFFFFIAVTVLACYRFARALSRFSVKTSVLHSDKHTFSHLANMTNILHFFFLALT